MEFYFDFLSPYAYFAWNRIHDFCDQHELELSVFPIPLAGLLDHWGHLGPAEIPPKRDFTFRHTLTYARHHDLPFTGPAFHPFHPILALRLALAENAGDDQRAVIDAIFTAGWGHGADLGSKEDLERVLDEAGLNGTELVARTQDAEIKTALKTNFERAIKKGVFGVPSMIVNDMLFWGNDQFDDIASFVKNGPIYSDTDLETFLAIRPAVSRK